MRPRADAERRLGANACSAGGVTTAKYAETCDIRLPQSERVEAEDPASRTGVGCADDAVSGSARDASDADPALHGGLPRQLSADPENPNARSVGIDRLPTEPYQASPAGSPSP